ncbi:MAG: hypothetical protein AAF609_08980, partial [Cyanobacteria bacterium P01_C01_bin.120]
TFEALIAFARSVVLMGFRVVTVGTLHHASPDSSDADDESHVCLVHDRLDFADTLHLAQSQNCAALYTFDQRFVKRSSNCKFKI